MPGGAERAGEAFGYRPRAERAGPVARARAGNIAPRRRSVAATALGWAVAGIVLCGGFWAYLGLSELMPEGLGASHAPPPGCTTLALDRPSGRITESPCTPEALHRSLTALAGPGARP